MKRGMRVLTYFFIALAAALAAYLFIALSGSDAAKGLAGFSRGLFGSSYSAAEIFVKAAPLTLAGLGVAVAFRSGFTNIGAEGQLYMGAIATTFIATRFPGLPAYLMLPLCMVGAALLGGLWALIPGFLKARYGISEVINTIMFNYIGLGITGVLVQTVLKDPGSYFPVSPNIPEAAFLPVLLPKTRLHAGIFIALSCTLLVYLLLFKTPQGFRMRAVGLNPRACQCMGISVYRNIVLSSLLSGGLAGLAGMCEVAGLQHRLLEGISPGYGYLAIIVALLGGNAPLGVLIAAAGVAALQVGSLSMQRAASVPASIASIVMGLVVLMILARKTVFSGLLKGKGE
jgi:simple sugar transport system permease protein